MNRKGDWINTYTGKRVYPFDFRSEDVDISDISHTLSNICRFGGHCSQFYSVAQHSLLASQQGHSPEMSLALLMHDAGEAYLGDLPQPIKQSLPLYKKTEEKILEIIFKNFGLYHPTVYEPTLTLIDRQLLVIEACALMKGDPAEEWSCCQGLGKLDIQMPTPLSPVPARHVFHITFIHLFNEFMKLKYGNCQ